MKEVNEVCIADKINFNKNAQLKMKFGLLHVDDILINIQ